MKKLKMARGVTLAFEEGCNKYLDNCRSRNLREGTINHYRQSYVQFYKYFGKDLLVKDIDFDNNVVHVTVTKNRKSLIVSFSQTMRNILQEFMKYRQYIN